jgi:hypothetical protein
VKLGKGRDFLAFFRSGLYFDSRVSPASCAAGDGAVGAREIFPIFLRAGGTHLASACF